MTQDKQYPRVYRISLMIGVTVLSSAQLSDYIKQVDFSQYSVTVVGHGNMGKQYIEALRSLMRSVFAQ